MYIYIFIIPATHRLSFPPPSSWSRHYNVGREHTGSRKPKHEIRNPKPAMVPTQG